MKRRQFFKNSSILASPFVVDTFFATLVNSFCQQALAESNGQQTSRNYVNIMMPGAPMRYIFDHWLKTSESDGAIQYNAMTGNSYKYTGNAVSGVDVKYFTYNQMMVPHLFSQSVNLSSGAANISSLLDNMLVMRGYGTGVDGHAANSMKQIAPLGGVPSLTGLVADNSSKTFEAIQVPSRNVFSSFVSKKGKALNILPINSSLKTLLEGFRNPIYGMEARALKDRNVQAFDKAKRNLASKGASNNPASEILNASLTNAETLMKKGINNLDGYMEEALPRYQRVIFEALRTVNIPGVSDKEIVTTANAIGATAPNRFQWGLQSGDIYLFGPDYDMREGIKNSVIALIAEGLAVAEYVINESLAQSVEIMAAGVDNFLVPRWENGSTNYTTPVGPANLSMILDQHATGAFPNVLVFNGYYRGLTAGVLELISKLKAKNNFTNTLIQFTSDFGRITRSGESGSDHGFNQMISSVIGGAITNGPYVVGNVLRSGVNGDYAGTQGLGAPITDYNQKGRPTPLAPAATVAELLNVEHNPYSNLAAPLVKIKNGKLEYQYGKGAIVES